MVVAGNLSIQTLSLAIENYSKGFCSRSIGSCWAAFPRFLVIELYLGREFASFSRFVAGISPIIEETLYRPLGGSYESHSFDFSIQPVGEGL